MEVKKRMQLDGPPDTSFIYEILNIEPPNGDTLKETDLKKKRRKKKQKDKQN